MVDSRFPQRSASFRPESKRWLPPFLFSRHSMFALIWVFAFIVIIAWQRTVVDRIWALPVRPIPKLRSLVFNLTDFGAVGDGFTVNTKAFESAILEIQRRGGGQLNVEAGRWLTAPFNLTSHMTLFLAQNAVILGIDDEKYWPLMPPLPSYGYGREKAGPRFGSLIHGQNLRDVIITDSCENVLIEDCYISVGDDGIAIKSGWDQYGIAYARPSTNILIRNVVVQSMISAGVSIGSEMSGGVSKIKVENLLVWNSKRGIRIKTSPGRGGYVRQITYKNITLENVRVGIALKTDYEEHPDQGYNPDALPVIEDINFDGINGRGVRIPVRMYGSEQIPVRNVTFQNMSVGITYKKKHIFQCSFVQGRVIGKIFPTPCMNLDVYVEGRLVRKAMSENNSDTDYDS
ncbi:probable polygalacturonase isoform X2 [Primulina eburnea]|uniref:probable polygalacturonase isoform X2 n=1 Tax=Primulina eburnea TaxID=1245227 RepID=UPI003C6BDC3A